MTRWPVVLAAGDSGLNATHRQALTSLPARFAVVESDDHRPLPASRPTEPYVTLLSVAAPGWDEILSDERLRGVLLTRLDSLSASDAERLNRVASRPGLRVVLDVPETHDPAFTQFAAAVDDAGADPKVVVSAGYVRRPDIGTGRHNLRALALAQVLTLAPLLRGATPTVVARAVSSASYSASLRAGSLVVEIAGTRSVAPSVIAIDVLGEGTLTSVRLIGADQERPSELTRFTSNEGTRAVPTHTSGRRTAWLGLADLLDGRSTADVVPRLTVALSVLEQLSLPV